MSFLIVVAIGFLIAIFIYGLSIYVTDRIFYRLPPGPRPLPFLGNLLHLDDGRQRWQILGGLSKRFGPFFTFYFGKYRAIFIIEPKVMHEVIVDRKETFSWRMDNMINGFEDLKPGVILANYDLWKLRRRFSMKAMRDFGMGKDRMMHNVQEEVDCFVNYLRLQCGKPIDPRKMLASAVSNVICSLVFGHRFDYDDKDFLQLFESVEAVVTRSSVRNAVYLALPILGWFSRCGHATVVIVVKDFVVKMLKKSVAQHRQDFDPDNIRDFPDLFIRAETGSEAMDFEDFGWLMTDMFLAGTETTSTALNWTLLYLSTWPEIQLKCQREIDRVIDTDRMPNLADRPQLVYIDAVMCEVLRFSCMVPGALLHSNMENGCKINGYDCPPYTFIMYSVANAHMNKDYWGDPELFRPERWIDDDGKLKTHPSYFMPFGIGPRICLGEALAKVEYFIFLTALLHRFDFSLSKPVDINKEKQGLVRCPIQYNLIVHIRS